MDIEYFGDKLEVQTSILQPAVVGGREYMLIENVRGQVTSSKAVFVFSDDMTLAVLDVTGKFRPKQFFAHPEIVLRTNAILKRQKALIKLLPTANTLSVNGKLLIEVEAVPHEQGELNQGTERQAHFANMPHRGASSDPTRYMFGFSSQVHSATPLGLRLAPLGLHQNTESPNPLGNLTGVEGDVLGIRGMVKTIVDGNGMSMPDDELKTRIVADIDVVESNADEARYKEMYTQRRAEMRDMERRLGINQFAQPRVGDSIATFMKSKDLDDISTFEQGNYHAGVVAESLDHQDYVTVEMRRRMDLEIAQKKHYYRKGGLDVDNMSDLDINHNGGALLAATEQGEEAFAEYGLAKGLNVPSGQTAFYRMHGRREDQSFHNSQKGPYFHVPAPLTVVFSAIDREAEEDLPPIPASPSLPVSKHRPGTVTKDFWNPTPGTSGVNFDRRQGATIDFTDDSHIGPISIAAFRSLFRGKAASYFEDESLHNIKSLVGQYQKICRLPGPAVLLDRFALLISMRKSIYVWHRAHPFFHGSDADYLPYYQVISILFRFLDLLSFELDQVCDELRGSHESLPAPSDSADAEVQVIWGALKSARSFKTDLKPANRSRMNSYFSELLMTPSGRKLLNDTVVSPPKGHKVIFSEAKGKSKSFAGEFVVAASKKASPKHAGGANSGADAKVYFPEEIYMSDASVMADSEYTTRTGESYGTHTLTPGFVRFASALYQAWRAMNGVWTGGGDALSQAGETLTVNEEFENPLRAEYGLPSKTSPESTSAFDQGGWYNITKVDTHTDIESSDWQIMSLG
ncbi:hypothetical protein [Fulvitalea axinellae]|uniref:hypothetical protein n=1 Tax=Fulvitalea axinellae TaxID=1182444 RepID=UPI0030CA2BF0